MIADHPVGTGHSLWRIAGPMFGLLVLLVTGCARQPATVGPFPRFAEFEGQEVRRVTFSGELQVPTDSLSAVIRTRPSRCRVIFLPICIPFTDIGRDEYRLDLNVLARDIVRIQLYHRDHGFYNAVVEPEVESLGEDRVAIDFFIEPGRQVLLRDLVVSGTDLVLPPEELVDALPLTEGKPFGRVDFLASADTIRARLLQRGHAYADVLRNYAIDTIAGVAEVEFVALPGPIVFVDTVVVEGNERLGERTVRRQIAVTEGEILLAEDLNRSQRNLYGLDLVSFASIRLAPDTLQLDQDQQRATVLVQIVEAAQFAVDASVGFGTVDCFRGGGRWLNRNFLGGGRRLELLGSLSRIGTAAPIDLGLGGNLCTRLGETGLLGFPGFTPEDRLDYRVAANFQQPSIFGTQNQASVNLHSERISEADAYVRESTGGRLSAVRELVPGPTVLTTNVEVERGRTLASPALLCVGFDTCTQDDLERLQQNRWSNSLSLVAVRDEVMTDGVSSRGRVVRGALDWASPVLGSDDSYLRVLGEASFYRQLRPGWVLATNVRGGRFLRGILGPDEGYIPPERRFYAGGPNSVRGYARNALGPTSYVDTGFSGESDIVPSATGGTQMLVGSAEVRMPSPWAADIVRLAAFLDAGHVSAPGAELVPMTGIRFTPGAGLRFLTPVGPFRLDVAYNPYPRDPGPLYRIDPRAGLVLVDTWYRPVQPSFLGSFRFQFALGQAF